MEEFKGTKGKWMVSGDNQVVSMPSQCKVAYRISGWSYDETKANIRLIATAPELLQSLSRLTEICSKDRITDRDSFYKEFDEAVAEAKEVINKALGKETK